MRAEVLGFGAATPRFEVQPEEQPDGTLVPPARVTVTLRPCWRKPPVEMRLQYLYTDDKQVALYAEVERKKP
jgi:hypothetical protein